MAKRSLAIAASMGKARSFGQGLIGKAGIIFTGIKVLDAFERYTDIEEDVGKFRKMEVRMIDRLAIAEKTLENAKRSPLLRNAGSVMQLETTMGQCKKYVDYLSECGPLLRGASANEAISVLGRLGEWLKDELVAVQMDLMLAYTSSSASGDGMVGGVPTQPQQVATQQGHDLGMRGAPGQMLGPADQSGNNALMHQHSQQQQQLLMPPPLPQPQPQSQPPPWPQQMMVPTGNLHGAPPSMLPDPTAATIPQGIGASTAAPASFPGWPNYSEAAFPMLHHPTSADVGAPAGYYDESEGLDTSRSASSMARSKISRSISAPTGLDEAGLPSNPKEVRPLMMHRTPANLGVPTEKDWDPWPDDSDTVAPPMMHHTPAAMGASIGSDGWSQFDSVSRTTSQAPPVGALGEYDHTAWTNFGGPSSFRSQAVTAAIGSEGTISPLLYDPIPQTAQMGPRAGVDGVIGSRLPHSGSYATKQMRKALGLHVPP